MSYTTLFGIVGVLAFGWACYSIGWADGYQIGVREGRQKGTTR